MFRFYEIFYSREDIRSGNFTLELLDTNGQKQVILRIIANFTSNPILNLPPELKDRYSLKGEKERDRYYSALPQNRKDIIKAEIENNNFKRDYFKYVLYFQSEELNEFLLGANKVGQLKKELDEH